MYYPELAGVFDRVRKPRGGNRIKGINPFLKYGREGALETALQERETALALLKAHTGQQRGHVEMVNGSWRNATASRWKKCSTSASALASDSSPSTQLQ